MSETTIASHEEYFWSRVNKNGPIPEHRPDLGPCWLWTGNISNKGYGRYFYQGIHMQAHVFSFKLHNNLPLVNDTKDEIVKAQRDHLCRVRHCVNDAHLEQVDRKTNILRGEGLPAQNARKDECEHRHGPDKFKTTRGGRHYCQECNRLHVNELYEARKATGEPFKWGGKIVYGGESPTVVNANKTHCVNGHLITGVKKNGKGRYCTECAKIASRDRMRRIRGTSPDSHRV